jgi:predicted metal-dependent peptidase
MIEKMPHAKASEWYFDRIAEWAEKNQQGGDGQTGIQSFDDHSGWGDVPEDQKDLVSGKVRSLVEKAVNHADSQSDGWGNIPSELREEIRRFVSRSVDWRRVLRYFVGMMCRGHSSQSFKRINKRYPYIHPGRKRGYRARVAIFIDQSGSVSDDAITRIFAALNALSKIVEFDVFHFDTEVDEKSMITWRKGSAPKQLRTRCGGTDFQAVTDYVNHGKNRGRWDGYIIATDGECGKPSGSRVKRAWIIVPGEKLLFETDEMVVQMNDEKEDREGR